MHQLDAMSLPEALKKQKAEYLETIALPLWEEKAKDLEAFKSALVNLTETWGKMLDCFFGSLGEDLEQSQRIKKTPEKL